MKCFGMALGMNVMDSSRYDIREGSQKMLECVDQSIFQLFGHIENVGDG